MIKNADKQASGGLMEYEKALEYIHSAHRFGSKPGLERMRILLSLMGDPQDALKFVHVAGTNGKGSTCAAIQSVLTSAGIKTGLYVSPFVTDFCERIQIDGKSISHGDLAAITELIIPLARQTAAKAEAPTEFEIVTAIALEYYRRSGCGAVVFEVGLGGRFDATNIISTPLASVITPISYDHTEILGKTLSKIAFEKCGIIKPDGVTVTCPGQSEEALEIIGETARSLSNDLILPDVSQLKVFSEDITGSDIEYKGQKFRVPLCGKHQVLNFITAYEAAAAAADRLGTHISGEKMREGFAAVKMPARLEVFGSSPLILLDGGHNPSAIKALAGVIDRYLSGREITAIMGICRDKDHAKAIPEIAKRAAHFIAVSPDSPRALDAAETAGEAKTFCADSRAYTDMDKAFDEALVLAGDSGAVVICGSFYLAGPMRSLILRKI
jgi:dihydrofolate synthase/folylpolyglutamate synthase